MIENDVQTLLSEVFGMSKRLVWYEVTELTSKGLKNSERNYFLDDYCILEGELIGRYSTRDKAINRMKRWAEDKGIIYDDNIYVEADPYDDTGVDLIVGVYYAIDNRPVKRDADWAYGTQAVLAERYFELDTDV